MGTGVIRNKEGKPLGYYRTEGHEECGECGSPTLRDQIAQVVNETYPTKMALTELAALIERIFREELVPLCSAGQVEYAHTHAFGNFDRLAKELAIPREQVLWVYLRKHLDGIAAWLRGHRSQRESVEGRINDAHVYLFLLRGMIEEDKANELGREGTATR